MAPFCAMTPADGIICRGGRCDVPGVMGPRLPSMGIDIIPLNGVAFWLFALLGGIFRLDCVIGDGYVLDEDEVFGLCDVCEARCSSDRPRRNGASRDK